MDRLGDSFDVRVERRIRDPQTRMWHALLTPAVEPEVEMTGTQEFSQNQPRQC